MGFLKVRLVCLRQKRTVSKSPRNCHKVPTTFLPSESANLRILPIFEDGAPDMNMMGTQIMGKFTLGATNEGRSSAFLPDDGYARQISEHWTSLTKATCPTSSLYSPPLSRSRSTSSKGRTASDLTSARKLSAGGFCTFMSDTGVLSAPICGNFDRPFAQA